MTTERPGTRFTIARPGPGGVSWSVAALLAAAALLRPLLAMAGVGDTGGVPINLLITIALALLWVGATVALDVLHPARTLAAAGALYGLLAFGVLLVVRSGQPDAPPIPPAGIVSIVVSNMAYGLLLGIIAAAGRRLRGRPPATGS